MLIHENTKQRIDKPEQVAHLLSEILSGEGDVDRDKEHFWVIGLNSRNGVLFVELVSLGIVDRCLIHPREVFRTAVLRGAKSIVAGHNHPSGDEEASDEDVATTRRLQKAGEILGISLIDHVIIGWDRHCSLKTLGLIE